MVVLCLLAGVEGNPIYYNPTAGNSTNDISTLGLCNDLTSKMIVSKIDADGNLTWIYQYAFQDLNGTNDIQLIGQNAIG